MKTSRLGNCEVDMHAKLWITLQPQYPSVSISAKKKRSSQGYNEHQGNDSAISNEFLLAIVLFALTVSTLSKAENSSK